MADSGSRARIGIIGCGNISSAYLDIMKGFDNLEAVAVADLDLERARAQAEKFAVPRACSTEELLADDAIDAVVNLTIPAAHAPIAIAALRAGKHVYNEKPLGVSREDGRSVLDAAEAAGLRVGCAPDTFLGGGLQTCRKLIDDGAIGRPIAATAFIVGGGMEGWHPDPGFFFQPGGGPMFDMGPYYLTALVSLLGPIRRVSGVTTKGFEERTIGKGPKEGTKVPVVIPTTIMGLLEFSSGAVGNIITSFDVKGGHHLPLLEIHGTEGSLSCPDPNFFGGPVQLKSVGEKEWVDVEITHGHTENSRSIGLSDMMAAIDTGAPHRASGALAYHVLDAMHAFHDAAEQGRHIDLTSPCEQPAPLPYKN